MKVLLFGASGTTTRAFTHACNTAPPAEEVRVVVRRSLGRMEAKLREFVHKGLCGKGTFSWYSPRSERFYVLLLAGFRQTTPFLVAGYPDSASNEELTKHSRLIRIAPIKIIRRVPGPECG